MLLFQSKMTNITFIFSCDQRSFNVEVKSLEKKDFFQSIVDKTPEYNMNLKIDGFMLNGREIEPDDKFIEVGIKENDKTIVLCNFKKVEKQTEEKKSSTSSIIKQLTPVKKPSINKVQNKKIFAGKLFPKENEKKLLKTLHNVINTGKKKSYKTNFNFYSKNTQMTTISKLNKKPKTKAFILYFRTNKDNEQIRVIGKDFFESNILSISLYNMKTRLYLNNYMHSFEATGEHKIKLDF